MHLPTESLPWAIPSLPVNNPSTYSPKEGDMVFGFFSDGENAQDPVIVGIFPGIPLRAGNAQEAFSDGRNSDQLSTAPVKPGARGPNRSSGPQSQSAASCTIKAKAKVASS